MIFAQKILFIYFYAFGLKLIFEGLPKAQILSVRWISSAIIVYKAKQSIVYSTFGLIFIIVVVDFYIYWILLISLELSHCMMILFLRPFYIFCILFMFIWKMDLKIMFIEIYFSIVQFWVFFSCIIVFQNINIIQKTYTYGQTKKGETWD